MSDKTVLIIPDEEINLYKNDLLNSKIYMENLRDLINNREDKKTLTIGLFGLWGTGKSSIIKTLQESFKNDPKHESICSNICNKISNKNNKMESDTVKFIKYDAWKYSGDS
ncbi:MAG: KAP family NTPase, partial [Methanobrevibacter sp.]|nr:KAP family NTPase [Methanobrevibacter sp.]